MAAACTQRIRELNDQFRRTPFPPYGDMFVSVGVAALDFQDFIAVMIRVRDFDGFSADNDPHGEHDFGSIDHGGVRYFWKIDYYDLRRQYALQDPCNPAVTLRVLTVMQASEY